MKFLKRKKIYTDKNNKILPVFLGLVLLVVLFLQVVVSNRLATEGFKIEIIEKDITEFTEKNELLESQIASASSVLTIRQKAKETGFLLPANPIFMSKNPQVAKTP